MVGVVDLLPEDVTENTKFKDETYVECIIVTLKRSEVTCKYVDVIDLLSDSDCESDSRIVKIVNDSWTQYINR